MNWKRLWPLTGIAYPVLVAVALLSGGSAETDREIAAFYAQRSNRINDFVLFFLLVAAALCLLAFAAQVRERFARAGEDGAVVRLITASGMTSAALLMATGAVWVSVSAVYTQEGFRLDPNSARLVGSLGYALFAASMMSAGLFAATLAVASRGARLLPAWLAWTGYATGASLVAAYLFFPVFLFLAWMLAASVGLIVRRPAIPASTPAVGGGRARAGLAVLSLIVLAGLASGCGGGDDRLTKEELVERADATCTTYAERTRQVERRFPVTVDPTSKQATENDLSAFSQSASRQVEVGREQLTELRGLDPPEDLEAKWDEAMDDLDAGLTHFAAAGEAAGKSDRTRLGRELRAAITRLDEANAAAREIGLKVCGAQPR